MLKFEPKIKYDTKNLHAYSTDKNIILDFLLSYNIITQAALELLVCK